MGFLQNIIDKGKSLLSWGEPKPPTLTASVKRNSFDGRDYQEVLAQSPSIQQLRDSLAATVPQASDFMADLHAGLFKRNPDLEDVAKLAPTHVANRSVMEELLATPQMNRLRTYTVGDKYNAALAMMAMHQTAKEALERVNGAAQDAVKEEERQREERERQEQELAKQIQELEANPPPPPLPPGAEGPERPPDPRVIKCGALTTQLGDTPTPSNQQVQQVTHQVAAGVATKLRAAQDAAVEKLEAEEALMVGFGIDQGELQRMPFEERLQLAQRLASNRLAEFAKLLGHFKTVQDAESRKRVVNAGSERHGITTGGDLTRMHTSETLNFASPDLETLMWARFADDQLVIDDIRGTENMGQGPIVFVGDESSSMAQHSVGGGTREAWCKALALALCDQARGRNRSFWYIGFAGTGSMREVEFPNGVATIDRVLEMTELFLKGSTDFEPPLKRALQIVADADARGLDKPDVVFVTDGEASSISQELMHELNTLRDKTSMKVYGIAIGCSPSGALEGFSDNTREITELVSDPRHMGDLFRTL